MNEKRLKQQDRITVRLPSGDECVVYNWINVSQPSIVRGGPSCVEYFEADIGAGDMQQTPEYITTWVDETLWREYTIDSSNHGIEVIDVTDDDVDIK